jgi:hypothetical protein
VAISVEILLSALENNGEPSVSRRLIEAIETPSKHRFRIGRAKSKAEYLKAIIRSQSSLN